MATKTRKKMKKKDVKYNPKKHIRPIPQREYLGTLDEVEASIQQFISDEIGAKRFEALEEAAMDEGCSLLKDVTMTIQEQVSNLFETPQEQFGYNPFTLGKEDYAPSKNFYDTKNFDKPLGQVEDE